MTESRPAPPLNNEAEITLQLLTAVHENSAVTQRSISRDLGIALGLANAYLKRCVKKGLIKVRQVPRNRYAYFLTPEGFAAKSRITAEYLSQSFSLFRQARAQYAAIFNQCSQRGWRRVALAGVGDLAEIASLCSAAAHIEITGIIDQKAAVSSFATLRVEASAARLAPVDAVVITDLRDPQAAYDGLTATFPLERILAPKLLGLPPGGDSAPRSLEGVGS